MRVSPARPTNRIALACALVCALTACAPAAPPPKAPAQPVRVVSLDYCADQYALQLLPRERILALSPDADAAFSYLRAEAPGVPQIAPRAEDVIALRPDLVIRTYGGGPQAERLFEQAGVPVLQVGYAEDLASVRRVLLEVADGLGAQAAGDATAAEMDARLAAIPVRETRPTTLYATSGGATTGPGSLIAELIAAAALVNFETEPGWRSLPLERLAYAQPDVVAASAFGGAGGSSDAWSPGRHPLIRQLMADRPTVDIDGAWTACGGWFVLDAVEALARTPAP